MILSPLDTLNQIQSSGAILNFQTQHFQASLTALKRISAFVRQAGDHLTDARLDERRAATGALVRGAAAKLGELVGQPGAHGEERGLVVVTSEPAGHAACSGVGNCSITWSQPSPSTEASPPFW